MAGFIFAYVVTENQVIELEDDWKELLELQYPDATKRFIGNIPKRNFLLPCESNSESEPLKGDFICYTCKQYLERNAMPPTGNQNDLQFLSIKKNPELQLSDLEEQLIAQNILFQKIILLPKSWMNVMKDTTVSIPIHSCDVLDTLTKHLRKQTDASLSVV